MVNNGFGKVMAVERSLAQSTKELKQIRKVLKDYPDNPAGRKKMLKKLKKYWRSPLGELERISYEPGKAQFVPVTEPVVAEEKVEDTEPTLSEEDKQTLLDALKK